MKRSDRAPDDLHHGGDRWKPTHGAACKCGHGAKAHRGGACKGFRCECRGFDEYRYTR